MKKNTALLTLMGTVGSIILTVLYALLITGTAKLVFSSRFKGKIVFALLENTTAYIFTAFVIFESIFFIWLFTSLAKEKSDKQSGISDNGKKARSKLPLATKIAGGAGVLILLGMIIANFSVYTEVSETSIKKKAFFTTRQYSWDDVYRYSLTCDESADLKYTVQMKDSTSYEFFKVSNSCSDEFINKYGNMLSFAKYLSGVFDNGERFIQKEIKGEDHMKKFYENEAVWQDIRQIIGNDADADKSNDNSNGSSTEVSS